MNGKEFKNLITQKTELTKEQEISLWDDAMRIPNDTLRSFIDMATNYACKLIIVQAIGMKTF